MKWITFLQSPTMKNLATYILPSPTPPLNVSTKFRETQQGSFSLLEAAASAFLITLLTIIKGAKYC